MLIVKHKNTATHSHIDYRMCSECIMYGMEIQKPGEIKTEKASCADLLYVDFINFGNPL